ncbi:MAG: alpha/beta hydrolase [Firmicutes bacterium]|nr:alpha/beta hydrolase [Bacillota bacterium]
MRSEHEFPSSDGVNSIKWTLWEPEGQPVKAVLQVIHGMSEYVDRYGDFAQYLNGFGIAVAGDDHLGHGRTAKGPEDLGYFAEKDGWKLIRDDEEKMNAILRDKYPGIPVTVMGHSMGSFMLRCWMAEYGRDAAGFIIMGTCGSNKAASAGIKAAQLTAKLKGPRSHSKMMDGMAFGSYTKRIENPRTPYDWLSTDDAVVDRYMADPLCGFPFTAAGYTDLLTMIEYIGEDAWYQAVPKDKPILIVSGWEDPVGDYGKGPAEVCERLQEAGADEVSLMLFENMRHEILNEKGKEAVYATIKDFILDE